jgi:hypothetical protein
MGKKSGSGSGILNEQPGSYFLELRNHFLGLKYLNSLMRIRNPGWKKFGSGIRINPGPTTLIKTFFYNIHIQKKVKIWGLLATRRVRYIFKSDANSEMA